MAKFNYWILERNWGNGKTPRVEKIGWMIIAHSTTSTATEIEKAIMGKFPDYIRERKDLVLLFGHREDD